MQKDIHFLFLAHEISSSNELRARASHRHMKTSENMQCLIFRNFSEMAGKKEAQFLSFQNIFTSNEPRERASH